MDEINIHTYSPQGKKMFKRKHILYFLLVLILLAVGYFGVYAGWAYKNIRIDNTQGKTEEQPVINNKYQGIIEEQNLPLPNKNPARLNVIVLGIRGADDVKNGGLLTDSIILFSLDKNTGQTAMISIPRDLFVNIKDKFGGKINEVYERGLSKGDSAGFTKDVFSRVSGVYIENIIIFDFQAFAKIIDAIDGVDVTLSKPFKEAQQWGYEFYLPAGKNHLNSEQALYYARSRYSSSDFDRARRQQQIIIAVKEKILSLGVLGNPSKMNSFVSNLGNSVKSDVSVWDLKDIALFASSLNNAQKMPKQYVLSTDNILAESIGTGIYVLLPKANDYSEIHAIIKNIFQ